MKESRITYHVGEKGTRPWGEWQVLDLQSHVVVKKLLVYPGGRISLQRHEHRTERWIVTEGVATVRCDNNIMHLNVGESIMIPRGSIHRLSNQGTATAPSERQSALVATASITECGRLAASS